MQKYAGTHWPVGDLGGLHSDSPYSNDTAGTDDWLHVIVCGGLSSNRDHISHKPSRDED